MSKGNAEEYLEKQNKKFPEGIVLTYGNFLKLAKSIFHVAKNDKMFDMEKKKLVKQDLPYGVFLAMRDGEEYIGVKIMVGSKEQIKEVFDNAG